MHLDVSDDVSELEMEANTPTVKRLDTHSHFMGFLYFHDYFYCSLRKSSNPGLRSHPRHLDVHSHLGSFGINKSHDRAGLGLPMGSPKTLADTDHTCFHTLARH